MKKAIAFLMTIAVAVALIGCSTTNEPQSSSEVEVIVEEETIIQGDNSSMTQDNSNITSGSQIENPNVSSEQNPSSNTSSVIDTPTEDDTVSIDYEWKSHSQDYKLIAFTFDDGPGDLMSKYVRYFADFEGAGTFFVNGTKIKTDNDYTKMQNAINYGWDIGNHGDTHLVAKNGGANGGEASYDEIKADIHNLSSKLEGKLKTRSGAPYKVNFYRPPNIQPTANTFKICGESNLAVIWLANDALDWGNNTKQDSYNVFKNGIGTWKDGDVILCHETSQNTYEILEEMLPEYYRAGYRFCSISELMQMRGVSIDQISGELNNVGGNRGMVTNILDAVAAGKK